jgi:DMATS type aromatic prenyltransferase
MRAAQTLGVYTSAQLRNLLGLVADHRRVDLLKDLLGPASYGRPISESPLWPSDVSDDATPVEFSVAFDDDGTHHVRVLGENVAANPDAVANQHAAQRLLDTLADRFGLDLGRFDAVRDLFLPARPQGNFSLWYSLIFTPGSPPLFKVYFNPEVRGRDQAPRLVAEALERLGLEGAYGVASEYALRRGDRDRLTFLALDLDSSARARVKVYISHHAAGAGDAQRAAAAVSGINLDQIRQFCDLAGGGTRNFTGRPLVSSYAFSGNDTTFPSNYSLYLPIRDYVPDDAAARHRTLSLLEQRGLDPALLDRAIAAVSDRPLHASAGLIAHVALRLGPARSGTTVYLSSEAYGGTPAAAFSMAAQSGPRQDY